MIHEEDDSDPTHGAHDRRATQQERNFDAEAEIVLSQTIQSFAKLSSRGSEHEGDHPLQILSAAARAEMEHGDPVHRQTVLNLSRKSLSSSESRRDNAGKHVVHDQLETLNDDTVHFFHASKANVDHHGDHDTDVVHEHPEEYLTPRSKS